MILRFQILAIAGLMAAPIGLPAAETATPAGELQLRESQSPDSLDVEEVSLLFPERAANYYDQPTLTVRGQSPHGGRQDLALRFGWTATANTGSALKVGEYQTLDSSAFWDVDRLSSDGRKTLDFNITGTDNEGVQGGMYYYRPGLSFDADYGRYLRRLDHKSFANFLATDANPAADPSVPPLVSSDLNVGKDYAIRVQELDVVFKGDLTQNVKWRLNVWGMQKKGERQVSAVAHCYNAGAAGSSTCHAEAQSQTIDWLTMEIEPVIEAKFGAVTTEYSRTIRSFNSSDEIVSRDYTRSHSPWINQHRFAHSVVPENLTQIDRLKFGVDLNANNDFYANLLSGDTHNKHRDTHRKFYGYDLRLTNTSLDDVTITTFAKSHREDNQLPSTFPEAGIFQDPGVPASDIRHPVDYSRFKAGAKSRWSPFRGHHSRISGLSFTGGYEYSSIERGFVAYPAQPNTLMTQPNTYAHLMHTGASMRWSRATDSFIRYKMRSINDPLFGLSERNGDQNTSQPEHEDMIEFGGTWTPTDNFLFSATFGIEKRHTEHLYSNLSPGFPGASGLANPLSMRFDEADYPIVLTAWYAPTSRWSLTSGYAHYTNWINQDIRLGDAYDDGVNAGYNHVEPNAASTAWRYGGRSQVVSLGSAYAWSQRLTLNGGLEWVRGRNSFFAPSPATAVDDAGNPVTPDWSGLGRNSDVVVQTTRFSVGVDYELRRGMATYFRYNHFNYDDRSGNAGTGSSHLFLTGLTAMY